MEESTRWPSLFRSVINTLFLLHREWRWRSRDARSPGGFLDTPLNVFGDVITEGRDHFPSVNTGGGVAGC